MRTMLLQIQSLECCSMSKNVLWNLKKSRYALSNNCHSLCAGIFFDTASLVSFKAGT